MKGGKSYFAVNKPYNYLSQFTSDKDNHQTLKSLGIYRNDVYAAGRLDQDSEGLLLLSNDSDFIRRCQSKHIVKEYLVQVDGAATMEQLQALTASPGKIEIKVKQGKSSRKEGPYRCRPMTKAEVAEAPVFDNFVMPPVGSLADRLWRETHVRRRKDKPTQFLRVGLREGKNRQVRKMLAAVGLPVLRLIRTKIGHLDLEANLLELGTPGSVWEVTNDQVLGQPRQQHQNRNEVRGQICQGFPQPVV